MRRRVPEEPRRRERGREGWKEWFVLVLTLCAVTFDTARAALFTAVGGVWDDDAAWLGGSAHPGATDSVVIPPGVALMYTSAVAITSVEIQGGGASLTAGGFYAFDVAESLNVTGPGMSNISSGTAAFRSPQTRIDTSSLLRMQCGSGSQLYAISGGSFGHNTRGGNLTVSTGGFTCTMREVNLTEIRGFGTVQLSFGFTNVVYDFDTLIKDTTAGFAIASSGTGAAGAQHRIGHYRATGIATSTGTLSYTGASSVPVEIGDIELEAGTLQLTHPNMKIHVSGSVRILLGNLRLSSSRELTIDGNIYVPMGKILLISTGASLIVLAGSGSALNSTGIDFSAATTSCTIAVTAQGVAAPPTMYLGAITGASTQLTFINQIDAAVAPLAVEIESITATTTQPIRFFGPGNFTLSAKSWGNNGLSLNDTTLSALTSLNTMSSLTLTGSTLEVVGVVVGVPSGPFQVQQSSTDVNRPVVIRMRDAAIGFFAVSSPASAIVLANHLQLEVADSCDGTFQFVTLPASQYDVVCEAVGALHLTVDQPLAATTASTGLLRVHSHATSVSELTLGSTINRTLAVYGIGSVYLKGSTPVYFGHDLIVGSGSMFFLDVSRAIEVAGMCGFEAGSAGAQTGIFGETLACGSSVFTGSDPDARFLSLNLDCTTAFAADFGNLTITNVDLSWNCGVQTTALFGTSGTITAYGSSTIFAVSNNLAFTQPVIVPTHADTFAVYIGGGGQVSSLRLAYVSGDGHVRVIAGIQPVPPLVTFDAVAGADGSLQFHGSQRLALPSVVGRTVNFTDSAVTYELVTSPVTFANPGLAVVWSGAALTFKTVAGADIAIVGRLLVESGGTTSTSVTFGANARFWSIGTLSVANTITSITARAQTLEFGAVALPAGLNLILTENVTHVYVRQPIDVAFRTLTLDHSSGGLSNATGFHLPNGTSMAVEYLELKGARTILVVDAPNGAVTVDYVHWTGAALHLAFSGIRSASIGYLNYQTAGVPATVTIAVNATAPATVPVNVLTGVWTNAPDLTLQFVSTSVQPQRASLRWTQIGGAAFNGTLQFAAGFPVFYYAGASHLRLKKLIVASGVNLFTAPDINITAPVCTFQAPTISLALTGTGHLTCQVFRGLSGVVRLTFDADALGRSGFSVPTTSPVDFDTHTASFVITVNGLNGEVALNTGFHTNVYYSFFTSQAAAPGAVSIRWNLDGLGYAVVDVSRVGSGSPALHMVGSYMDINQPIIYPILQIGSSQLYFHNVRLSTGVRVNGTAGSVSFDAGTRVDPDTRITGIGMALHLYDATIDGGSNADQLFVDPGTIVCHGGTVFSALSASTYYVFHRSTALVSTNGVTTVHAVGARGVTFPRIAFSATAVLNLVDATAVVLGGTINTVTYDTVTNSDQSVLVLDQATQMPPLSTVKAVRPNITLDVASQLKVELRGGASIGSGSTFRNVSYMNVFEGTIGAGLNALPPNLLIAAINNLTFAGPPIHPVQLVTSSDVRVMFGDGVYVLSMFDVASGAVFWGSPNVLILASVAGVYPGTAQETAFDGLQIRAVELIFVIALPTDNGVVTFRSGSFMNVTQNLAFVCLTCSGDGSGANVTIRSNTTLWNAGAAARAVVWNFDDFTVAPPRVTFKSCLHTPYRAPPPFVTVLPPESGLPCVYPAYDGCSLGLCGAFSCVNSNNPQNVTCGTGCSPGFAGVNCTNIDDCASGPCTAPDTCVDGINSYMCVPPPDPCVSSPCQNGGTCSTTPAVVGFSCACVTSHWTGPLCATPVPPVTNPCASVTCHHGGTCVAASFTAACNCPSPYWTGARCDDWVDPCVVNSCLTNGETCQNGGTNSTTYQCVCLNTVCAPPAIVDPPALVSLTPSSAPSMGGIRMVLITRGFTGTIVLQLSLQPPGSAEGNVTNLVQSVLLDASVEVSSLSDPIPCNVSGDPVVYKQLSIAFFAPPYAVSKSAYRSLVLSVTPDDGGVTAPFVLRSDSLLYVPFNPCLDAGVSLAYANGVPFCDACPRGGYCPGGGRIWPVAGFWSTGEFSTPIECAVPEACPGSSGDGRRTNVDGSTITSQCAEGYTGYACSQCQASYYQSGLRCFSCGSSESDTQQLQFLIAAAIIIFVSLSIAVATLSSRWLALVVTCLIAVQQFVTIGKSAVQRLPASVDPLVQLLNFLSVVNFDVQMVKPGCIVPQLTFLSLYWTTIVLVVVSTSLFALGAAARATWVYHFRLKNRTAVEVITTAANTTVVAQDTTPATATTAPTIAAPERTPAVVSLDVDSSAVDASARTGAHTKRYDTVTESGGTLTTDERDWASTWCDVFTARLIQSLLILGTLMFLKIFTLCLQCANCEQLSGVEADESGAGAETTLRLVIDPTQVCYSGPHASAIVFDYFLLIIYGLGFPLLKFTLLYRTFATKSAAAAAVDAAIDPAVRRRLDAKAADHYGYLYRGLIRSAWYFRLSTVVTTWGFGLQLVFARSIAVQVFVPGVFFLINVTLVGHIWPYTNNFNNLLSVAVGFGGAFQVLVYLGVLGTSNPATRDSIFFFLYWMLALTSLSVAFFVYTRYRERQKKAAKYGPPATTGPAN